MFWLNFPIQFSGKSISENSIQIPYQKIAIQSTFHHFPEQLLFLAWKPVQVYFSDWAIRKHDLKLSRSHAQNILEVYFSDWAIRKYDLKQR